MEVLRMFFGAGFGLILAVGVGNPASADHPKTRQRKLDNPASAELSRAKQRKIQRHSKKVKATQRVTDYKTAYGSKAMSSQHVDIKITPPGPRGKTGQVLVEVYNRSKIYLDMVKFELELLNNGWDRLEQTITVDRMEAGGSTLRKIILPGKANKEAVFSIKKVRIKRMEMFSYDATPVKLNYNTDLILR